MPNITQVEVVKLGTGGWERGKQEESGDIYNSVDNKNKKKKKW